jgi:anti-sigma factor RsiW
MVDPLDGATAFTDTCREVVALVTEHLEGALPPSLAAAMQTHLTGCAGCAAYLDQIRATIRALGRLRTDELPAG